MSVVFLCVGAAKAGTSWLYHQLSRHPECHFRAIKELHYFDALEAGRLKRQILHHRGQQSQLLERLTQMSARPDDDQARRLTDRAAWLDVLEREAENIPAYLEYLHHGAGTARVVGEMTPAYATLPTKRLHNMARIADDVRVLYLLRDPVERLWSHVRMMAARRDPDGQATARRAGSILSRVLAGEEEQIAVRCDYAGALARLSAAIPGGKFLIEVFEDMISGEGLARICDFLSIRHIIADPLPIYAGQPVAMSQDQRTHAAAWLAPQYDAVEHALGRIPGSWQTNRALA